MIIFASVSWVDSLDEIDAGTRLARNKDVSTVHAIRAASQTLDLVRVFKS